MAQHPEDKHRHSEEPETLTARLRRLTKGPVERLARAFDRLGFRPNTLTVIGLLMAGAAALLAAQGRYGAAGLFLLLGAPFDAMDGAVARVSGRVSRFGALLDSTLDRYGEGLLLAGVGYHMADSGQLTGVALAFIALLGSVMVSYVRARAEGLGIEDKVGLLTRVERVVILILALLSGQMMIGLWVLAILTQVTVAQRVWRAYRVACAGGE